MTLSGTRLNVALTTNSTSPLTGALTTAGGLGVAKEIWAGGKITAASPTVFSQLDLNRQSILASAASAGVVN
jgi:hypothetical protein